MSLQLIQAKGSKLEATQLVRDTKELTIPYHSGKANMVVNAFSRKVENMGSLAYILVGERPLALDVHALDNQFVRLYTVQNNDAKEVTNCDDGVLRLHSQICVSNMDGLCELILEETHSSRYFIHPGAAKMYLDLRQHYWWRRMKKDSIEYVARCFNYQQVTYED
ncbi:uncharacterized protein [Nicotiana tomentosiformis]|uniref:uncharacterized protein n=1 Tax=Nicotiana tomentosiformis TaxID=4098 RepID=UPI00388C4EAB